MWDANNCNQNICQVWADMYQVTPPVTHRNLPYYERYSFMGELNCYKKGLVEDAESVSDEFQLCRKLYLEQAMRPMSDWGSCQPSANGFGKRDKNDPHCLEQWNANHCFDHWCDIALFEYGTMPGISWMYMYSGYDINSYIYLDCERKFREKTLAYRQAINDPTKYITDSSPIQYSKWHKDESDEWVKDAVTTTASSSSASSTATSASSKSSASSASSSSSAAAVPTNVVLTIDNSCGGQTGFTCGPNACCSASGWCGTSSDYCGTGCQIGFGYCGSAPPAPTNLVLTTDNSCGAGTKNTCGPNACCGASGYCGITDDFCVAGCQSGFGHCGHLPLPTSIPVSNDNTCGYNSGVISKCPSTGNVCCSDKGMCGSTIAECGIVRYGCQSAFGVCSGPEPAPARGSYPPLNPALAASVINNCTIPGMMAMTFDDGPGALISQLLDLLAEYGVKATFFINAFNNGDITTPYDASNLFYAYSDGHQIASHTYDHLDLSTLSIDEVYSQMYRNENAIYKVIGVKPKYMRPPYGSYTPTTLTALGSWGYKVIWQNLDSQDYAHQNSDNQTKLDEQAYSSTISQFPVPQTSFISLQHDFVSNTVLEWVEEVIQTYTAKGYIFGTVGDCLGETRENWYK